MKYNKNKLSDYHRERLIEEYKDWYIVCIKKDKSYRRIQCISISENKVSSLSYSNQVWSKPTPQGGFGIVIKHEKGLDVARARKYVDDYINREKTGKKNSDFYPKNRQSSTFSDRIASSKKRMSSIRKKIENLRRRYG